jgi:phage terminase large subunit GpA-like protein
VTQVDSLVSEWSQLWRPPERLPLSQWVRKNFWLSRDYGAHHKLLVPFGWQDEILDSFTDPAVNFMAIMSGTQMIKTLFMQCALAYVIAEPHAQGPVLISQPNDEDARNFSKERLGPMIRDNAALSDVIDDTKGRDASNTILGKKFPGGSLSIVGSNAPGNFARRTIQYFFADEVDKYVITKEGDQLALGFERTAWFKSRRKIILTCSPTVDGRSTIQKYFNLTDQRRPWVPCPHCGEYQVLRWPAVRFHVRGDPRSAVYHCVACDGKWTDLQRWDASDRCQWRPDNPQSTSRGYWISHLYSRLKTIGGPDPLSSIAANFMASKGDRSKLQVWINTNLAELWRDEGERPEWFRLRMRAEDYPFNDDAVVPMAASFLVVAVDFQKDWLQVELQGWGRNLQKWSLGMWKVEKFDAKMNPLQTSDPAYRQWLQDFLQKQWQHESGAVLPIMAMGLDTGNRPDPVYDFARTNARLAFSGVGARIHYPRTVVALKGASTADQHARLIVSVSQESAATKRGGIRIVHFGGGFAKTEFYGSLHLSKNEDGSFPRGYCHFPKYDDEILQSFCAEERVVHSSGSVEWVKMHPRNEALDLHCMGRAVAALVGIDTFTDRQWDDLDRNFGIDRRPKEQIEAVAAAAQPQEVAKNRQRVRFRMDI